MKITKKTITLGNGYKITAIATRGYKDIDNNLDGHIVTTKSQYIDTTKLTVTDKAGNILIENQDLIVLKNTNKFIAEKMAAGAVAQIGCMSEAVLLSKDSYDKVIELIQDLSKEADTKETTEVRAKRLKPEQNAKNKANEEIKFNAWLDKNDEKSI